jgi:NADH:ubiquinone oxidoreductase subunit 6 (subunit J)
VLCPFLFFFVPLLLLLTFISIIVYSGKREKKKNKNKNKKRSNILYIIYFLSITAMSLLPTPYFFDPFTNINLYILPFEDEWMLQHT